MIPLQKLQAVKRIIVHKDCADGIASAMILKHALPQASVEFVQYDTVEHRELKPEEGMLFCDFSPWLPKVKKVMTEADLVIEAVAKKQLKEFVDAGVIVLDHHGTQERVVKEFGTLGVYADGKTQPGVSGAVLAFQEVWVPVCRAELNAGLYELLKPLVQDFATLAGIRDTWIKNDSRFQAGCEQREALLFWTPEDLLSTTVAGWARKLEVGSTLWAKSMRHVQAFVDPPNGIAFDLIVGFEYVKDGDKFKLVFSTRSHTGFRCDLLATQHGGGGHPPAAGFSVPMDLQESSNPYKTFLTALREFEAPG